MSEHLTFDEMVSFLDSNILDNKMQKMAYRINEHISKCDECFKQYNALLELDNQLDLLRLSDLSDKQYALIETLFTKGESPQSDAGEDNDISADADLEGLFIEDDNIYPDFYR